MRVSLPMQTAECALDEPSRARIFPAAYPRRRTKSGVMGLCPTVPRSPSVPKCLLKALPDRDYVARFLDVVDPQYCRPALQREQSHREAPGEALVDRAAGQLAERRLARQSRQDRQVGDCRKILQQDQVVLGGLAEAEAG